MPEQNAKSHASVDRVHMAVLIVLVANVIWVGARAAHLKTVYAHWEILVAMALVVAVFKSRTNALKVQDRLIRLEERLRFEKVLSEPLLEQSKDLTTDQYIGLRFACDEELPGLVTRALAEGMDRKQIKAAVVKWREDHCRL